MSFCLHARDIALCSGENVIIFTLDSNEERIVSLPKSEAAKDVQSHNNEDLDNYHSTTNVVFSEDGEYLAICTKRKQLCLFHRKTQQLVANRTLIRAASRIRFTPKNDIIVADKTGDAYLYSTEEPTKPPALLLGHLSMLLDVLVTRDNKYILTADRDEKIRVSMFPNSYNIVSYCLGHTKFVTNIAEISNGCLISAGGDGYFRFWNIQTGEEVHSINYAEKFLEEDVQKFNEKLKKHDVEEEEVSMPVKHLRVGEGDDCQVIVASFYCSNKFMIYTVKGESPQLSTDFVGELDIEREPLDCFLQDKNLWILTDANVIVYEWKDGRFVENVQIQSRLEQLNESWKKLRHNSTSGLLFPVLYKRKYDNIQEYQERKKVRLNKIVES